MDEHNMMQVFAALGEKIDMLEYRLKNVTEENHALVKELNELRAKEAANNGNGYSCDGRIG